MATIQRIFPYGNFLSGHSLEGEKCYRAGILKSFLHRIEKAGLTSLRVWLTQVFGPPHLVSRSPQRAPAKTSENRGCSFARGLVMVGGAARAFFLSLQSEPFLTVSKTLSKTAFSQFVRCRRFPEWSCGSAHEPMSVPTGSIRSPGKNTNIVPATCAFISGIHPYTKLHAPSIDVAITAFKRDANVRLLLQIQPQQEKD